MVTLSPGFGTHGRCTCRRSARHPRGSARAQELGIRSQTPCLSVVHEFALIRVDVASAPTGINRFQLAGGLDACQR